MKMRYAGLVVCTWCVLWGQETPKNQQPATSTASNQTSNFRQSVPPPSATVDPSVATPQKQPAAANAQQQTQSDSPVWFLRPEWVIVWVTFVYTLLTWRTLRAIKRQADLMAQALAEARRESDESARTTADTLAAIKTQADAALKTVQVMIDSERPWIVAHMEQSKGSCLLENGNVRFKWTIKNVGKSPAKLIEAGARATLDTLGPPLYPVEYKMETLDDQILVPGDSAPFFVFWSKGRLGKTLDEFNDLAIIYGCIRYRSATSADGIYETRFAEASTIRNGVCGHFEHHWPVNPEDIRCT